MKATLHFIRLSRPVNLLFVAATLLAMRYWVVLPLFEPKGLELISDLPTFLLLVASVVSIAAAGNIINDYFDTKTDAINKPNSMIVGVHLDRKVALISHGFLTVSGLVMAAIYGYHTGTLRFVVLHLFVAISLWFYSTYFKRETGIGNVIIALLTGLVPMTIAFFDVFPVMQSNPEELRTLLAKQGISISYFFKIVLTFILGFSLFSFLGNLIRELFKDLADLDGDKRTGRKTLPILWSETVALWISVGYVLLWTLGLLYVQFVWLQTTFSLIYIIAGLIIPMIASLIVVFRNPGQKGYKIASGMVKGILLLGLVFSYFIKSQILV